MNKIFMGASVAAVLILQGLFAAPVLAQTYNYSGYAYPSYEFPQPQYQYPSYQYPYNYNYQYQYGYPYQNYQTYNYPPSITGVSGPTQLAAGQTGTWTLQIGNSYYPYGYTSGNYLSYSVSWGDENINPYASAYSGASNTGTFSHTYVQPGTYTIRFTVTNAWGQSTTASETVVVTGGCGYNPYGYNPYQYNSYQNPYQNYGTCYQQYPYTY